MKVLIAGIAGKIGRLVATALDAEGHDVQGLDMRAWRGKPESIELHRADLRKRPAKDVFRRFRPDAVLHMATVTHLTARGYERHRINLGGTRALFEYCAEFGVKQCVFAGRHTFYGAAADSPLYHTEDEPPMAVGTYPELSDLVAADLYAGSNLWRNPKMHTVVLRTCYTLGPQRHGTLAAFLRGRRVPYVLGYDPLFQFMHEKDTAKAICLALSCELRGVFNVCGPTPVPLTGIIRAAGRQPFAIPEPLFAVALGRFGLPKLPRGAFSHLKYPVVVDGSAFVNATNFAHAFDEAETIEAFRGAS